MLRWGHDLFSIREGALDRLTAVPLLCPMLSFQSKHTKVLVVGERMEWVLDHSLPTSSRNDSPSRDGVRGPEKCRPGRRSSARKNGETTTSVAWGHRICEASITLLDLTLRQDALGRDIEIADAQPSIRIHHLLCLIHCLDEVGYHG